MSREESAVVEDDLVDEIDEETDEDNDDDDDDDEDNGNVGTDDSDDKDDDKEEIKPEPAPEPKSKKTEPKSKKSVPKKTKETKVAKKETPAPQVKKPKEKPAPPAKVAPEPKAVKAPKGVKAVSEKDTANARLISSKFKLLGDATRLNVIMILSKNGEVHVGAICDAIGQSQPATSHHLALLRHSGMIEPRREGKNNFYSLTELGEKMAGVIEMYES